MAEREKEPPFEGGSQPVQERAKGIEGGGRTAVQTVILLIAVLVVLAGLLWFLVPILTAR